MNSNDHPLAFPRSFAALFLFLSWFAQVIPLAAFTAEAEWKFETRQNTSSEWWQTLSIQTVPGVVYHLQKCSTLDSGDWTNIATTYGSGGEWVCPIFPCSAPGVVPLVDTPYLPSGTATLHRFAYLILEKTTTGGTLISWGSLDDHTPRRMLLPDVVLDPVWEEFDSAYLNEHGNYLFALSPHFHTPVAFTAVAPTLGTLDTAMVAGFIAALPEITANIENSVAIASQFSPQSDNPGDKAFYRFSADWSVDSDGDGRYDWEEIILDGNNPFAEDTNGDGTPDQAAGGGGTGPGTDPISGLPLPNDAEELSPVATIEQLYSTAHHTKTYSPNDPSYTPVGSASVDGTESTSLATANSYPEFESAFYAMSPSSNWGGLERIVFYSFKTTPYPVVGHGYGSYTTNYATSRRAFRLHLDGPAPAGGYRIPLRFAKIVQSFHPESYSPVGIISVDAVDLMLEVAAGQTIGTVVELPDPNPGQNEHITYIPATVELSGYNHFDGDYDVTPLDQPNGVCITPTGAIHANLKVSGGANFWGGRILWQKRMLSGAGIMGDWADILSLDVINDPYEGEFVNMEQFEPGIYQLQAVLLYPNGRKVEFPYIRMRNAKSIRNGDGIENPLLKAGKPDYFGVARNDRSVFLREEAIKWLGATGYAVEKQVITDPDPDAIIQPTTKNVSKCNLFVTHISNKNGAKTSYWARWIFMPSAPIARDDWFANPEEHVNLDVDGWGFQGVIPNPAPGMTVASPQTSAGSAHGHVGFLDYDGSWINAGSKTVNKSVHLLDPMPHYRPNSFRSR